MTYVTHQTAKPSHYDYGAGDYDAYNEKNSEQTNRTVEGILNKHNVKTVLDMTCGTGSQVFWLTKHGYKVIGSDINARMLAIARSKAEAESLDLTFLEGDMCTLQVGQFDAVITIFHAIGHLTIADFEKAMRNIHKNLKKGGIYVFDIFNLGYFLTGENISKLTTDVHAVNGRIKTRDIQYSTINEKGVLASYTTSYIQEGDAPARRHMCSQTIQIYKVSQLEDMLQRNGFLPLGPCGIDGGEFHETTSERIVLVAKKI